MNTCRILTTVTAQTTGASDRGTAVARIVLGLLFTAAGLNKLITPKFIEAWRQQIIQADLPLPDLVRTYGPYAELGSAALLLTGRRARLGALSVFLMMIVALHVHRKTDAQYLPMERKEPILALASMIAAALIMRRGPGAWALAAPKATA